MVDTARSPPDWRCALSCCSVSFSLAPEVSRPRRARGGGASVAPEADHNVQSPQVKVVVLVDANLARAANLLKVVGKGVVDLGDELLQPRLPLGHELAELAVEPVEPPGEAVHLGPEPRNLVGASLKLAHHVGVGGVDELELGLLGRHVHLQLLGRLAVGELLEQLPLGLVLCNHLAHLRPEPLALLAGRVGLLGRDLHVLLLRLEPLHEAGIAVFEALDVRGCLDEPYPGFQEGLVRIANRVDEVLVLEGQLCALRRRLVPFVVQVMHALHGVAQSLLVRCLGPFFRLNLVRY